VIAAGPSRPVDGDAHIGIGASNLRPRAGGEHSGGGNECGVAEKMAAREVG